ncbi:hypothetical protein BKA69DRAFT_809230 [Paraphysoderma sedebokerense]|nr:hypothetical protein BKA69DRAFT_809230 [Paraphysoderma sedebokerense]
MISSQCTEEYRVMDEWITGFPKTTKRDDPFHYKFFLRERNSERTLFRRFISDPEGMQELLNPNFSPLRYSIDPTSFTLKLRSVSQSVHNRLSELYAKHSETKFTANKTTLVEFLFKFALFLMNDTQLVILEPDTLSNAYVIFRTLNARGVRLNLLDNLKASLFAKLQDRLDASDSRASTRYLEKWERCENMLTTGHGDSGENFKLLFEYMLRIHSAMDNTMTLGDKTALFIKKSHSII